MSAAQSAEPPQGDSRATLPPAVADVRLTQAYGRGLLRRTLDSAFGSVQVPEGIASRLHMLEDRGTVLYVGRSAAFVTFLFFQHLAIKIGAPLAQAVVGLALNPWAAWGRLFAGRRHARAPMKQDVLGAIRAGKSALVFLRQPDTLVTTVIGEKDPFPELVRAQRTMERPIFLVPQLLLWERRPPALRRTLTDALLGDPEAPGFWRSMLSFFWNRRQALVKMGEPIDLKRVVEENAGLDDAVIARKVRGALYQHLARETRVLTGPRLKPPERLLEQTLRDRALRATVAEVTRERGRADGSVDKEAARDLKEIAARYSPTVIDLMALLLDVVFDRIYDGIDVDQAGLERIRRTLTTTPLVVCPSHKSHVDYLVMSHVFHRNGITPPHIAAGINLSFWPLGPIFRGTGAFFIRRSFKGDRVYTHVLKAYIRKLLKEGFTQEFFIEGGRSRTGKILQPRLGMLSMEVEAWIDGVRPDVAFVPSWIGYSQIIEARSYAHELGGGEKKAEDIGALLRAPKVLTHRYGRVYIRFDEPVSLARLAKERGFDRENHTPEQKRALVRALGFQIADGINRVTALTPSGLLATALLSHDQRAISTRELVDRMDFLTRLVLDSGGTLSFTHEPGALDPMGAGPIAEARASFERDAHLIAQDTADGRAFHVPDGSRITLDFQKNTAMHFFVADALLATGLLTTPSMQRDELQARTLQLSRVLKQEFIYSARSFLTLFDERVAKFKALGLITEDNGRISIPPEGAGRVRLLADLLVPFVEAYAFAAESLSVLLKGPVDGKEFIREAMIRSQAALVSGRLRRAESRSKVLLENALALFEELGIVLRQGEKDRQRSLAPAGANQASIDTRAASIRSFLIPHKP